MTDPATAFAKMIPGYDLLQGMAKSAGAGIPGIGQWVTPTLDPDELEKRIEELRTVQFWLEQNARMLATTIQAMEVQRMTLSTLKTMNLSMGDLAESLKIRLPEATSTPPGNAGPAASPPPTSAKPARKAGPTEAEERPAVPTGVIDPMQWWGALTQQFADIAGKAMKEGATAMAPMAHAAAGQHGAGATPPVAADKTVARKPAKAEKPGKAASAKPARARRRA